MWRWSWGKVSLVNRLSVLIWWAVESNPIDGRTIAWLRRQRHVWVCLNWSSVSLRSFLVLIKPVVEQKDQKLLQIGFNKVSHLNLKGHGLSIGVIKICMFLHRNKKHWFDNIATENTEKVDCCETYHEPVSHFNSAYVRVFNTILLNQSLTLPFKLRGKAQWCVA